MSEKFSFSEEEIKEINGNLGFIINDWSKHLVAHIVNIAIKNNVSTVYMNTENTVDSGGNGDKIHYFYERLPSFMGFKKEKVSLRGKSEFMWAYHFDRNDETSPLFQNFKPTKCNDYSKILLSEISCSREKYSLSNVPQGYQGAILSLVGRKESYSVEDLKHVFNVVTKKKTNRKPKLKFFYDWNRNWSGGQRFKEDITEVVVSQLIHDDWQDYIFENKALLKFWSYLLSQSQHFSNDTIGFGLVSKINSEIWVINEIQTDVINKYRALINMHDENKKISYGTLKDMLEANGRSNWIPYLEKNVEFRNQLLNNPNDINQLCDDKTDIDEWIKKQGQVGVRGLNLACNF